MKNSILLLKQKINRWEMLDEYGRSKRIKDWQTRLIFLQMIVDFIFTNLPRWIVLLLFLLSLINGNIDFALQVLFPLLNDFNK